MNCPVGMNCALRYILMYKKSRKAIPFCEQMYYNGGGSAFAFLKADSETERPNRGDRK